MSKPINWRNSNLSRREKYRAYLLSPEWKLRREAAFARWGRCCAACGESPANMTVHHLTYIRIFREPPRDLLPLCQPHHRRIEKAIKHEGFCPTGNVRAATIRHLKRLNEIEKRRSH